MYLLVQESYDEVIGRPVSRLKNTLVLLSVLTLGLVAAIVTPLWAFVLRMLR